MLGTCLDGRSLLFTDLTCSRNSYECLGLKLKKDCDEYYDQAQADCLYCENLMGGEDPWCDCQLVVI